MTTARHNDIAIIAMACRYPGENQTPEQFYQFLLAQGDGISDIPADRWDKAAYFDADKNRDGKMYVSRGGFLTNIAQFDPVFFGISPKEAPHIDPQHRWLLELNYELLQNAGLSAQQLRGSDTAVFIGQFMHDYEQLQLDSAAKTLMTSHSATGPSMTLTANRLSYCFDWHGPSVTLDTACSSSLVALDLAVKALQSGDCQMAVAGGVNILLRPELTMAICKASMLSPDGRCKSFDASANGYVRSEGVGLLLLKDLAQARADGDPVLAVIKATGVNQDGQTKGITVPNGSAQQRLVRQSLQRAGLTAAQIQYVEAHGTGTAVGDPIEVNALAAVFGGRELPEQQCVIGSVKSNIGHTEAAAGVAGVIKTVMAMRAGLIPANLHLQQVNPAIALELLKVRLAQQQMPWPDQPGEPRRALVNSFGFGGTNANVVLEQALDVAVTQVGCTELTTPLLCLSSQSRQGLKQQAGRMADYLLAVAPDDKAYLDICYSSLKLREHFRYRLCVSATAATAAAVLADVAAGTANTAVQLGESTTRYPSACWVFSGMGTTWPGMGRDLYQHNAVFRQTLQRIDQALQQYSGWSLLDTLLQQDDAELIHRTDRAQPAIFAIQAALAATLQAWGLQPGCIVGHSAGEVAAAYVAGALSFDDAIRVIYHRSQLQYSTEGSGRMLAVGLSLAELEPYLAPYQQLVAIAAVNSAEAITLSGDASALATIAGQLEQQGLFARFLNVAVPYHSPLMDPLKQPLWQALQGIQVQEPQIPLYSTVTGSLSTTAEWGAEYWPDNVREPVLFQQAIQQIEQDGWQCFIEIAPHSVLASSIQKNVTAPALICSTLKRDQDGAALLQQLLVQLYLGGAELPAAALYPAAKAIYSLPNYAWQQQSYWHEAPAVQQARLYNLQSGSAAGKPQHPLLGASVAGSQILWQQQLSPVEPAYLADHQVEGQVVYPGAAYVETALALARHQLGFTQITLTQVEFFRALFLPAAQQCQFETRLDADNGSYQIWSQLPEQPWQLFSAGRLQSGSGDAPAVMALAALQARLQRHWQAEEFYQHCQRLGLDYQQSFQGVHQAWSDGGDALAEIRLPVQQAASGYLLHPIALDSAFQTLFCTIEAGYLPVAIGQLNFYQSPGAHFYAYLHTRFADAQQIHGDLYLLDPAGGVLVELLGVELKASRTELPQASAVWSDLYQFCWQRSHWQPAVSGSSQILLCSAEPALLADALAALPDCQIEVLPWSVLQQADSLLARLQQHANCRLVVQLPATVLHAELSAAAVQQQCMDLLLPLLTLAQQSAVLDQRLQCLVLTTAAASLWPELVDSSSDPVQAAVWGFTRVWQTEQAGHQLALLDLPAQPTAADWQLAAVLCQQVAPEQELAIRQGQLYQQRYQALTSAELLRQQERSWQQTEPGHYQLQPAQSQAGQLLQLQSQPFAEHSLRLEKTVLASQHFRQFCRAEQRLLPQLAQGVDATGAAVLLACQNVLASWQPATSCQQWSIPATLIQQPLLLPSLTAYLLADDLLRHQLQLAPGQTLLIHQLQDEVGLALLLLARSRQIHLLVQCQSADWRAHCQSLDLPLMTASAVFQLRQQLQSSGTLPDAMVSQGQATELALLLPLLAPLSPLVLLDTQADSATLQQAALAQLSLHNVSSAAVLSRAITQCGQTLPGLLQQLVSGDLPLLPAQACPPLDSILHNPGSSRHPLLQLELPLLSQVQLPPRPLVRSDRSYLISGGLGGLGLAMLDWLLAQGATELVLTSRRPPASALVQRFASLASAGIRVHCFQGDIADATTVAALFEQLNADFKPLAGIFHAAGVLSDGTLQQQDAAKFATVLAAKVQGSWLLHQHSLALPLDFMVCFSSIAAVVGWAGQANYAAANSFMDQLMQMRRVQGLPGLSINWGPWAEAGMAAELTLQDQRRMEKAGMTAMNNADSVRLMQLLLQYQVSQAGIFRLDWRALPQVYGSQQVRTLFSALVPEQQASNDSCFLSLYQQASTVQRHSMLTVQVGSLLAEVLGLASDETPDASRSMFEFGLNSLMALDFKNKLQQLTGLKLPATLVMKYPTIHLLTAYLAEQLAQAVAAPVAPPAGVLYWSPAEPWVHLDSHWSGEIGLTATVANMIRQGQSSHFNIAGLLQIDAAHFDWQVLTDSLQMLWCRHDGCRVRLSGAPDWQQQIAPMPALFSPDYHDFSQLTPADARQALRQVCQTLQQSFSFSLEQPLYRLACFKLAESEPYRLFICFHHFIADGRALAVLLEDFERIYRLRFQQAEVVLPHQSYRLQDWHQRIAHFVANELPAQLPYWQRQLQLAAEFVLPPTVQRNAQRTASDLTAEVMWLTEPLVQQLQKFCQRHQVEMTDLGCYALGQALSPLSHSHCLWVDLVLHGRHQLFPEVEIPDLFGQISEYGSVYLHWDGKALASAAVQSCAALRRAAPNAGIGLKALHYLAGDHAGFDSSRQPKVLINFDLANYQGRAENWWQLAAEDCGDSATLVVEQEHSYSLHLKAMAVGAEIRLSLSYWRDEYDQARVQQILQRLQQQLLRAAAEGTI